VGYYDDHSPNRYSGRSRNRGGIFIASLVGAILGAILVIIAIPTLSNQGMLPYKIETDQSASPDTNNNDQQNIVHKEVAYEVTSDTTKAVAKAENAVVGVTNIQATKSNFWSDNSDGNGNSNSGSEQEAGTGSGVIYKKVGNQAFVVTNHHVVEGAAKLEVTLANGTKLPAKLLGSDIWTDLAVLQIDGSKVTDVAVFGDSDTLKLGEPVVAIGNPLGPTFSGSVTQGVISGLKRTIPVDINQDGTVDWQAEVLQTDAAINPGNSGGALINMAGQVIGINSMKIAQNAVEGIGLSIPINSAKPIIDDLEKYGSVKRPYMGVDLKSVNEIPAYYQSEALKLPSNVNYGVAVRSVEPNSPAAAAGLRELDVIVEMDGQKINDVIDLRKHLYEKKKIGEKMTIKFYRNGKLHETTLRLTGNSIQ
jgi:serine protease Do